MARTWYNKTRVKCPYYSGERDNTINCEGLVACARKTVNVFDDAEAKLRYKKENCWKSECSCMIRAIKDREE